MALDMEELRYLTDAQKERYMLFQRGFESEFWQQLKQWAIANSAEQLQRLVFAPNWDTNRISFGARAAYEHMSNLEQITDNEFSGISSDNLTKAVENAELTDAEAGNQP